tara:strand:+ start:1138 stop:1281 length:144 start_codon:yes stop_codon:yes gene_type:complete
MKILAFIVCFGIVACAQPKKESSILDKFDYSNIAKPVFELPPIRSLF